jgi:hypothetical protein
MNGLTGTLALKPNPGVPFWGTYDAKYVGGRTGFSAPPSFWDIILYGQGNTLLPGLVKVRRCTRSMKLLRKEHPSSDYETQTFMGWSVVEFDFDLILWTKEQLQDLQAALPVLFPGAGDPPSPQTPTAVTTVSSTQNLVNPQTSATGTASTQQIQTQPDVRNRPPIPVLVSHPALQVHGVSSLVFQTMEGPMQISEDKPDIFKVHFKTVQFRPAVSVQKKTLTLVGSLIYNSGIPADDQTLGPSASGGADPGTNADYTNFLGPLLPGT